MTSIFIEIGNLDKKRHREYHVKIMADLGYASTSQGMPKIAGKTLQARK